MSLTLIKNLNAMTLISFLPHNFARPPCFY